jgi:hypothetical protein
LQILKSKATQTNLDPTHHTEGQLHADSECSCTQSLLEQHIRPPCIACCTAGRLRGEPAWHGSYCMVRHSALCCAVLCWLQYTSNSDCMTTAGPLRTSSVRCALMSTSIMSSWA